MERTDEENEGSSLEKLHGEFRMSLENRGRTGINQPGVEAEATDV